jgi:DnaJ family protein C protein 28
MDKEQPPANNEQSLPSEDQRVPRQRRPGQQWANLVEERIREAMERGDFDHLQGEGKPLDLDENPYAGDRALAFHLLKSQHVLPPELELGREVDDDLKRAEGILAEFRRKRAALKEWQRTSLALDPLARWRLPSTGEAQQSYKTVREEYARRYEQALREVRSKILTLNIIAPSALHRKLLDVEVSMQAFYKEFPEVLG